VVEALEGRRLLAATPFDVLVFSKTAAFRHDSIPTAIQAIRQLGAANNFTVTATEDVATFNDGNLARYEAVVFLMTTGDVLDATQQAAFERYIGAGGGYVGIHSAADTEYDWPWYGGLVGAYFQSHPNIQQATINVADRAFPATAGLPQRWVRTDEWYNFRTNPRGNVHVLMTLDEKTYTGGTMGFDHPLAWCQQYSGGRSFYTEIGHTAATYSETAARQHILGGIEWAAGVVPGDAGATVNASFRKTVLDDGTTDPFQLDVAADGRVFFIERAGAVKAWSPATGATTLLARVPVPPGGV
jgi:type 1 glutamine amidotransferase